jgi:hypothetical protein
MPHEEIDGVSIWVRGAHGDPEGPPLVALHSGILTFEGTFGDVLPWLTQDRRVIGVELQGHGHTTDTGRPMSIERFADDVAELADRVVGGGRIVGPIRTGALGRNGRRPARRHRSPGSRTLTGFSRDPSFARLSGCKPAIRGG